MFVISKNDFLEEVKAEMFGYEEFDDEMIDNWVKKVDAYIEKNKNKDAKIKVKGNEIEISLKDETDFFKILSSCMTVQTILIIELSFITNRFCIRTGCITHQVTISITFRF